jgi:hypothetical protein
LARTLDDKRLTVFAFLPFIEFFNGNTVHSGTSI